MSRRSNYIALGASSSYGQHDMGFRHLTSLGLGRLQPVVVQECVPNDQIKCDIEAVVTNAPFASAMQSKTNMYMAAFFVRNRVIWENWNAYITGIANYSIPSFDMKELNTFGGVEDSEKASMYAFHSAMGLPVGDTNFQVPFSGQTSETIRSLRASILPYRAVRRIWWDFFRDSDVIPDSQESSYNYRGNSGDNVTSTYRYPQFCAWAKDWMTNNLRTPNGDSRTTAGVSNGLSAPITPRNSPAESSSVNRSSALQGVLDLNATCSDVNSNNSYSSDVAPNIQSLRDSSAIQKWLEKCNALGGRMRDRLLGMFGSSVAWESLNMAEYLGSNMFTISGETTQANNTSYTSEMNNPFGATDGNNIKGQLSTGSKMQLGDGLKNINFHVQEHGYFIVLAWVMPDVFESEGLPAHWLRGVDGITKSRFDFLTPEMVGTGFEPLRYIDVMHLKSSATDPNFVIQYSSTGWNPFAALGYRGRYESYKYNTDIISGCFADPRYKASMSNMYYSRDLLAEANIDPKTTVLANGIPNAINHDTLSRVTFSSLKPYYDKFMYNYLRNESSSDTSCDYFICNFKIGLNMVRPISGVSMPVIETASSAPINIGGTRL